MLDTTAIETDSLLAIRIRFAIVDDLYHDIVHRYNFTVWPL